MTCSGPIGPLLKKYLTYDIVHKLADLYIVKEHMAGADPKSKMAIPAPMNSSMQNGIMK